MVTYWDICILMFVLHTVISPAKCFLTDQECIELGFNRLNLSCSTCTLLKDLELPTLKIDCLECCESSESLEFSSNSYFEKYPNAYLEICDYNLASFPQVQAFVKSDKPKKFPNLQLRHVQDQKPQIKFLDLDGSVAETLSITKWDTDTIEEFLQMHLLDPIIPIPADNDVDVMLNYI